MKCSNCGYESQEDFTYCASCGTKVLFEAENYSANKFITILKDKLFLMFCIFLSIHCVFSIAGGAIPIIVILACVFSWIAYAKAQKDTLDYVQIKNLSGCLYAQYVITNILSVVYIIVGILLIVFAEALSTFSDLVSSEFNINLWDLGDVAQGVAAFIGYIAGAVIFAIGIVFLIFNILGIKKIHKFVKSIHISIKSNKEDYMYVKSAKKWLYFFAVISAIGTISTLSTDIINSISTIGFCGFLIVSICLIEKYFVNKTNN